MHYFLATQVNIEDNQILSPPRSEIITTSDETEDHNQPYETDEKANLCKDTFSTSSNKDQSSKLKNDQNNRSDNSKSDISKDNKINNSTNTTEPIRAPEPGSRVGVLIPWDKAKVIFSIGDIATITDVDTGLSFQVQRRGGSNHADCQPLTAKDTKIMLENYGGQWSWARRAIVVTVDGHHMAASMNGMPHGAGAIQNNNFNGHFCIHFLNSKTHESNKICPIHQAMVRKAAGK